MEGGGSAARPPLDEVETPTRRTRQRKSHPTVRLFSEDQLHRAFIFGGGLPRPTQGLRLIDIEVKGVEEKASDRY